MKVYLGIIGKIFSGKETVYQLIKEMVEDMNKQHRVAIHRFSDPLNECLQVLALPKEREYQQRLSTILRREFGETVLGNALVQRALAENAYIVCLDGIRRPEDTVYLCKLSHNYLVYVDTPLEIRFERAQKRADRPIKTIDELMNQQNAEADSKIDEIAKQANIVLDNSGTLEDLRMQILAKLLVRGLGIKIKI